MSIFDKLPTLKQDKNNKFLIKLVELLKILENKINSSGGDVAGEIDQINNQIITINNSITNINLSIDEIKKNEFDIKTIYNNFIITYKISFVNILFGSVEIDTIKEHFIISGLDKRGLVKIEDALSKYLVNEKLKYLKNKSSN